MMLVYRIENADGEGPFSGSSRDEYMRHGYTKGDVCWYEGPGPYDDARDTSWETYMNFSMANKVCGTPSLATLRRWFRVPEVLGLMGFKITLWRVADDEVGWFTYQCVFDRARAELVATYDLPTSWGDLPVDTLR